MYQVSWMTQDEEDRFELYSDMDDVRRAMAFLKGDDVALWTVSLTIDSSDPNLFEYEGMSRREKGEFVDALIGVLPKDFSMMDIGATMLSILSAYNMETEDMAVFFGNLSRSCKMFSGEGGRVIQ